jgi:hypothetical protein
MNTDIFSFLQLFGDAFWLQTFDDRKEKKELVHGWTYKVESDLERLKKFNSNNAGVYFCVNSLQADTLRKAENVDAIRAFFVDLDGAPLQPVLDCVLKPNVIVQTSVDRFHAYWIMDDYVKADRRLFKTLQRAIADRFNGDKSVTDLCRVMRLPGFYNMKKDPFMVKWELIKAGGYKLEDVQNEFGKTTNGSVARVADNNVDWISNDLLAVDAGRGNVKAAFSELDFDAARLRGALSFIDPDDYSEWIEIMLALKGASVRQDAELSDAEGYEYFLEWSQQSNKFDERVCEIKWQDADVRGDIGLGTIYFKAKDKGWAGERRLTLNDDWLHDNDAAFAKKFGA